MAEGEPRLLMAAPAPVIAADGGYTLDAKFIEGMKRQVRLWPGRIDCLLRSGAEAIPFGAQPYDAQAAGFGLQVLGPQEPFRPEHFRGYDLVVCSADDDRNFPLPQMARAAGARVAAALEYDRETRLKIALLDGSRGPARRLYSALRILVQDRRRQAFLARMDGLQANGYPAYEVCRRHDPDTLLFLDNRMTADLFVTEAEMQARRQRLLSGGPLQLVYSGRLERMKGVQDLLPLARRLRALGVSFQLNIFGTGSLAAQLEAGIAREGLAEAVHLHAPLEFESELVPHLRRACDIFVCCHPQSDPSCTYIESMGCGMAVAGYGNRMWSALQRQSRGGWAAPVGAVDALAQLIAGMDKSRAGIFSRCEDAAAFARQHGFEGLSRARADHLLGILRHAAAASGGA